MPTSSPSDRFFIPLQRQLTATRSEPTSSIPVTNLLQIPVFALGGINRQNAPPDHCRRCARHRPDLGHHGRREPAGGSEGTSVAAPCWTSRRLRTCPTVTSTTISASTPTAHTCVAASAAASARSTWTAASPARTATAPKETAAASTATTSPFPLAAPSLSSPSRTQMAAGMAYHRIRLGSEKFIIYFQKFTNTYAPLAKLREIFTTAPSIIRMSSASRSDQARRPRG